MYRAVLNPYMGQAGIVVSGALGLVWLMVGFPLLEKHTTLERPAKVTEPLSSAGQGGTSPEMPHSSSPATSLQQAGAPPATEAPFPGHAIPSFDVVSIEPAGEAVMAGRSAPGAT